MSDSTREVVIVGGGAGGLELATKLARLVRHHQQIHITLVDSTLTHLWKPLWHEVAAGTLNPYEEELSYIGHAYKHHFNFVYGSLSGLDRKNKLIFLDAVLDESGKEILPARSIHYDFLVIAIGSVSNDFNTKGVRENCFYLDNLTQAAYFQRQLINKIISSQNELQKSGTSELTIAIVGGGATGVELAAELHYAINQAAHYSRTSVTQNYVIKISIIEAAERILSALPERVSAETLAGLTAMGIVVYEGQRVTEVTQDGLLTNTGLFIKADIKVWAAGIKAPEILTKLDGLAVNKLNQLIVNEKLQTTEDNSIFAMGDCASCPQAGNNLFVPPRAQAAHQQAMLLAKSLNRYLQGKELLTFHYNDYGSLVTLSRKSTVGSVMGKFLSSFFIEGKIARLVYLLLYKKHQAVLHGYWHVFLTTINGFLVNKIRPRLKLH